MKTSPRLVFHQSRSKPHSSLKSGSEFEPRLEFLGTHFHLYVAAISVIASHDLLPLWPQWWLIFVNILLIRSRSCESRYRSQNIRILRLRQVVNILCRLWIFCWLDQGLAAVSGGQIIGILRPRPSWLVPVGASQLQFYIWFAPPWKLYCYWLLLV